MKLTRRQYEILRQVLRDGPSRFPLTFAHREQKAVVDLLQAGCLERLNSIDPGPPVYEITRKGRLAHKEYVR